jgi:DNA-binding NarL/FixJ family response regulator
MCEKTIKVLIVDNHPCVIEGIKVALSLYEQVKIVGELLCPLGIPHMIDCLRPDIVVMESVSSFADGLLSILQIKHIAPHIKIILFTRHEPCNYLSALMQLGISGCVPKKDPVSELQWAIAAVSQGGSYLSESICHLHEGQTAMLVH